MKRSTKAALLSGLVFPGLGHVYLREYYRGLFLVAVSLAALSVSITYAYEHALLVVDQIYSGEVSLEAGAIAQAVSDSTNAADSLVANAAVLVLVVCWLAGILDSYRLGAMQRNSDG